MVLLLDTSAPDTITCVLFDEDVWHEERMAASNREILACVDATLSTYHMSIADISGLMVVVGAGGFTSTRLAVTFANTVGYVRKIPLLGISPDQARDPRAHLASLFEQPMGRYISASYSADPHIGKGTP